jgi:RecG-like helicase
MTKCNLERNLQKFRDGEVSILVSTTALEEGIIRNHYIKKDIKDALRFGVNSLFYLFSSL